MPRYNVIDAVEAFLASGDEVKVVNISKYASLESAYLAFFQCIKNKRYKGCHVHKHKGKVYLIKD